MNTFDIAGLLSHITEADVVEVCQELVRLNSVNPPGNELGAAQFAAGYLKAAGLEVEMIHHNPERASILARLRGSGEAPGVLLSGHLDTVPVGVEQWLHDPFGGEVADGRVWGRGASDMKGGVAAIMVAVKALAQAKYPLRGDILLALTAGEEVDSLGATVIAQRTDLGPLQALLVAEPSSNELFVAEKGALWLEVSTHGKTAHGSMPDLGKNAILMMVEFLNELKQMKVPFIPHPLLGGFSMSANTIEGGVKTNVVPDHCAATIDMRTVPGQDHKQIVAQFNDLVEQLEKADPDFRATVTVVNDRPPVTTDAGHPMVIAFNQALAEVTGQPATPMGVRYYTDAAAIVPVIDLPVIICGPGEAGMAHQPNENVEVEKLVQAARIYTAACARMAG
jgi:succinyl-diaminopimelate desuccinylase